MRPRRRSLIGTAAAAGLLVAPAVAAAACTNGVVSCDIAVSGGHHYCVYISDAGYPYYKQFQLKAADGSPAVPYSWVQQNGPSGYKTNYTWTSLVNSNSNNWLLIDNQYSGSGPGTYRVNIYTCS